MKDLDELIRGTLSEAAQRARFDRNRWEPSVTRQAAPRARLPIRLPASRYLAGLAVAAVLAAAIAIPLVLLSGLGSGTRQGPGEGVSPTPTPTGDVRHADRDDGLSITIPTAWTFHQDPSGPAEPRTVFAVGSWPFPTGGECAPMAAQEQLPAEGTLFWVIEYRDPQGNDFPHRPEVFHLDQETLATYECSGVPSYLIRFQDAGRFFQAHVAFGPEASESLGPEVLRALETLEVTAPVPEGCPADFGPWSDPDCPWSEWARVVVKTAGYEIVDDTGSAFEVRTGNARFYIWNTETDELPGRPASIRVTEEEFQKNLADEGYRQQWVVAGEPIYTDGIRTVWVTQGLAVWVEASALPGSIEEDPSLARESLEALVRASLIVKYNTMDTRP